jgi:Uma2 family endonuclease
MDRSWRETWAKATNARIQTLIAADFLFHYKQFWSAIGARLKVSARRYRIPDVCLFTGEWPGPERGPLTDPPSLVVEVLSPDDRAGDMEDKIADYFSCGVKYVWVVNPETRRAFVHTIEGSCEARQGVLRTENPTIEVPLSELFE